MNKHFFFDFKQVKFSGEEDIHFVAIGDWGSGASDQEEVSPTFLHFPPFFSLLFLQVAAAMGEFCLLNRCDFVISTGDNMYHDGVDSPFDEKFDTRWKDMYSHPSIAQLTW